MASENAPLIVSLTLSKMMRGQYVERSKERALALLKVGRVREAVASMMMDMRKGPNCGVPREIHAIGICAAAAGDAAVARAYIEGFDRQGSAGPPCPLVLGDDNQRSATCRLSGLNRT